MFFIIIGSIAVFVGGVYLLDSYFASKAADKERKEREEAEEEMRLSRERIAKSLNNKSTSPSRPVHVPPAPVAANNKPSSTRSEDFFTGAVVGAAVEAIVESISRGSSSDSSSSSSDSYSGGGGSSDGGGSSSDW